MLEKIFPTLGNELNKTALVEGADAYSYSDLKKRVQAVANNLIGDEDDLHEQRIAFFMPASLDYVSTLLGIWAAGGIAVPLNVHATEPELEHCLSSAGASCVVATYADGQSLKNLCNQLGVRLIDIQDLQSSSPTRELPDISESRRAMMLFTSGTTSKPKGVVSTHANLKAQISTLVEAWSWSEEDVIPLFLPLHHIHGIINVLCCALSCGATAHLYAKFDAPRVLQEISHGTFNVFMAVPTIYIKIIEHLGKLDEREQQSIFQAFESMRLNVSGSAACPVTLFNQWQDLSNQVLLERYGMTEIGMALSNPYDSERRAGYVGQPLPGVEVALFDDQEQRIEEENQPGEIRIRGANVFLEYWGNPEATQKSFKEGWFCTGDIGIVEDGYYRIMGRSSVDIIKSGGYKLSALEIESVLLTHPAINECAVIGVEDPTWGEVVTTFVVLNAGESLEYSELKTWCESRLSPYKIPKQLRLLDALPRNAMGKVTKPDLRKLT